ncbi:jg22435, partial [Pararge aegeria aegeria]
CRFRASMWLLRSKRERANSVHRDIGPAIVATADGAAAPVQVVSQMYNAMPRKRGLIKKAVRLIYKRGSRE